MSSPTTHLAVSEIPAAEGRGRLTDGRWSEVARCSRRIGPSVLLVCGLVVLLASGIAVAWRPAKDLALHQLTKSLGKRWNVDLSARTVDRTDEGLVFRGLSAAEPRGAWTVEIENLEIAGDLLRGRSGIRTAWLDGLRLEIDADHAALAESLEPLLARWRAPNGEDDGDEDSAEEGGSRSLVVRDAELRVVDSIGPLIDARLPRARWSSTGPVRARLDGLVLELGDWDRWELSQVVLRETPSGLPELLEIGKLQGELGPSSTTSEPLRRRLLQFGRHLHLDRDRSGSEQAAAAIDADEAGGNELGALLGALAKTARRLEPGRTLLIDSVSVAQRDGDRKRGERESPPATAWFVSTQRLAARTTEEGLEARVVGRSKDARVDLRLDWPRETAGPRIRFATEGLALPSFLPVEKSSEPTLRGDLTVEPDSRKGLMIRGDVLVRDVVLSAPWIGSSPLVLPEIRWQVAAASLASATTVEELDSRIEVEGLELGLAGSFALLGEASLPRLDVELRLPTTPCAGILSAIPSSLLGPELASAVLEGEMAGRLHLGMDPENLEETGLRIDIDDGCRFVAMPEFARIETLRRPFLHYAPDPEDPQRMTARRTGPGTRSWTPLARISHYVVAATLAHEDGGFWNHRGFAPYAIESSLVDNLRAGRVVRGASTISMQLAKNLYLRPQRTVQRKVREAFLTWWLERHLSKSEVLELYLNIVEYGPGIHGIDAASRHYFDTRPDRLGPAEAAFLAYLLPSPRTLGPAVERHGLGERARSQMRTLLRHMHRKELIDRHSLESGFAGVDAFELGSVHGARHRSPRNHSAAAPSSPRFR